MKIIVEKDGELLSYLYENLDMPKKRIKQYLTHGSIFVNNVCTTKYNYKVVKGMNIIINDERKVSTLPFEVLYEDNFIIVVNKPSGLLTIATAKEKEKTLYHLIREYLRKNNKFAKVFIVHRLDKDTSGIIVLAKDEKTKNLLQESWNEFVKVREYMAVVEGSLKDKEGRLVHYLKETKTNLVYVAKGKDGKEAITNYKVIKENENYSELSLRLETGRKNQIRVQLAHIRHPIVGDKKYGKKTEAVHRLLLHANRLKFYYPILKKELTFETPIPTEFKKVMK